MLARSRARSRGGSCAWQAAARPVCPTAFRTHASCDLRRLSIRSFQPLAKYVDILFRHRVRFLLLFIVLPLELATACVFLFPHESAVMSLWVETPTFFPTQATGWNQYLTPAQNTQDALNQLTDTSTFAHTLGVDLDASHTFQDQGERDAVLGSLSTDIRITATGSHLVLINYTCPRRPICIDVLNNTLQIYRDWQSQRADDQEKAAREFYQGQLADANAQLTADSAAVNQYLTLHPKESQLELLGDAQYQVLARTVTQDQGQITALQGKLDAIDLTSAAAKQIDDTMVRQMDPPRVVGGRLSALPRKQMIIAGGLGLAVALVVLVVMAWLDRTVRESRELESRLKLPVVSTIPDLATRGEAVA